MKASIRISLIFLLLPPVLSAQWTEFNAAPDTSVWASSVFEETLGGKLVSYGPDALFDGDTATPWVEAAVGGGRGENVTILLQKTLTGFSIVNGFAASPRLYKLNSRPKTLTMSILAGLTAPGLVSETDYVLYFLKEFPVEGNIKLDDVMTVQSFDFPVDTAKQEILFRNAINLFRDDYSDFFTMIARDLGLQSDHELSDADYSLIREIYGFYALKLTIGDVYEGDRYSDTCLSEISLSLEPFF